MSELAYVGQRVVRVDAAEKVTGRAVYGVDLKLPGMLHAKILRSSVPHARIVRIDTTKAERLRGVRAVVTGKDAPYTHNASIIKDWPFFAQEKVRHVGEAVAAVAAVDDETADEALELIEVEYDELPAVFDAEEAMKPAAPLVHERMADYPRAAAFNPVPGTNICNYFKLRRGDVERAFAGAAVVVEERYTTAMMQHCPMEVHVAVGQRGTDGRLTVWTSAQSPYWTRFELATALGIPMSDIRVIIPYVGGGFGAKHAVKVEQYVIALAMKTGNRPVRLALTRAEEFGASLVRQPTIIDIKTGAARDGQVLARQIKILWNTGAYADLSPAVSRNAGFAAAGPYVIPNVWIDSYCIYTNQPVSGAFRGFGVPEVTWAGESQLDVVAQKLGIDPLELRLQNAVEEGSESVLGEVLHSVGVKECLRRAADAVGWREPKTAGRGRGIACMHKSTGTPTSSAGFVKLNEDGTVSLLSGAVEMGQGSATVLAQIVAEDLGVKPEHIRVVAPDTDVTPYERSSTSSRTTFHAGNALLAAAGDAKRQILEIASDLLEAAPEDLELHDERVWVKGVPDRSVPLSKLWQAGMYSRGQYPILGRGAYSTSGIYDPLDPRDRPVQALDRVLDVCRAGGRGRGGSGDGQGDGAETDRRARHGQGDQPDDLRAADRGGTGDGPRPGAVRAAPPRPRAAAQPELHRVQDPVHARHPRARGDPRRGAPRRGPVRRQGARRAGAGAHGRGDRQRHPRRDRHPDARPADHGGEGHHGAAAGDGGAAMRTIGSSDSTRIESGCGERCSIRARDRGCSSRARSRPRRSSASTRPFPTARRAAGSGA